MRKGLTKLKVRLLHRLKASPPPGLLASEARDEVDDIKTRLDESGKENRNLLIAFSLFVAACLLLCLSITDDDLLLSQKSVALPALSIPIPLWGVQIFVPLLIIFFHYDVLLNAEEHHKKLLIWVQCEKHATSNKLYPFMLDFARLALLTKAQLPVNQAVRARVIAIGAWAMYIALPVFTIILYFAWFARLQSYWTLLHLTYVVTDLVLLLIFRFRIRDHGYARPFFAKIAYALPAFVGFAWVFTTLALWFAIRFIHSVDGTTNSAFVSSAYGRLVQFVQAAIMMETDKSGNVSDFRLVPRLVVVGKTIAGATLEEIGKDFELRSIRSVSRFLTFSLVDRPASTALNQRLLLFSIIQNSRLARTNFHYSDLQWSNFYGTELSGSSFRYANLAGASFDNAVLHGVEFVHARMLGAHFENAKAVGLYVGSGSICNFCNFDGSYLARTSFEMSDMTGSSIRFAVLDNSAIYSIFKGVAIGGTSFRGGILGAEAPAGTTFTSKGTSCASSYAGSALYGLVHEKTLAFRTMPYIPENYVGAYSNNFLDNVFWRFEKYRHMRKTTIDRIAECSQVFDSPYLAFHEYDVRERNKFLVTTACLSRLDLVHHILRDVRVRRSERDDAVTALRNEPKCKPYLEVLDEIERILPAQMEARS
jgi:uncharacterized protein YjbI with pentapeptide repeats